jgi:hypothetical protein
VLPSLGEELLNRVQIRRVGRPIKDAGARIASRTPAPL